ncbi:MAG: UDP-3-O-acyl-N-acetylglucosamine deacetylase [Myxococcota bacterium]
MTLSNSVVVEGTGVHTGHRTLARLGPGLPGTGIVFVVSGVELPARLEYAEARPGATVMARSGVELWTPEHLLAAACGLGMTDLRVEVDGPELPILDGSARPWCDALVRGGPIPLMEGPRDYDVQSPVRVEAADGLAAIEPASVPSVEVHVDFGVAGPSGIACMAFEPERFLREVAPARTFVLASQVERLQAEGRGLGAALHNTVVWDRGEARNPGGLRFPDEPVRHKLLDALGDLALLGARVRGRVIVHRGSHALHHALMRHVLAVGALQEMAD